MFHPVILTHSLHMTFKISLLVFWIIGGSVMSGEGSVEVSVPTDLTVTSDGGDSEEEYAASRRYAREMQNLASAKLELQKTVELQKLELQTKDALLVTFSKEQETALINALAQKDDQISSKKIQINRLEVELSRTKEELSIIRERAARELAQLSQKCAVFQENHRKLSTRQDELRGSLANLQLSEEQFTKLRHTSPQDLTLQQYTALRVYEMVWPLRLKLNETEAYKFSLESALAAKDADLKARNELYVRLQKTVEDLQRKSEHFARQVLTLKDEQRSDDFRIHNYARIKAERNQYEEERSGLSKKNSELELTAATLRKERCVLDERCSSLKDKTRKQEHDLAQYKEDSLDLRTKLGRITEQFNSSEKQLRFERERNEDLHVKYIAARGDLTSINETSSDQQCEIKVLREKLQTCTLNYSSLQEKVNFLKQQKEYLSTDVEKFKIKYSTETQALETEVKELKASLSSLSKNRDTLLDENSKLHQELQSLEISYREERALRERESSALNIELQRVKSILAGLEELEDEYSKNIKAAAGLPEDEANKMLDEMLPGIRIRGDKTLARSIDLTRRILVLERHNTEACATIQQLTEALEHLKSTVSSYKTALGLAGQPSANLLQRIASQDDQITSLQGALHHNTKFKSILEDENKAITHEVINLKHKLDSMSVQTNELNAIKHQLHSIITTIPQLPSAKVQVPSGDGSVSRPQVDTIDDNEAHQSSVRPIIITKNIHKRID